MNKRVEEHRCVCSSGNLTCTLRRAQRSRIPNKQFRPPGHFRRTRTPSTPPSPHCTLSQALMRHVASPHPAVRAHLLLLIGKIRLRRLQTLRASRVSKNKPSRATTPPGRLERVLEEASAKALTAALSVSFHRGGHDWRVMGDACLGLVMLHAFSDGSGAVAHEDHVDGADADILKVCYGDVTPTVGVRRELWVGCDRVVSACGLRK